MSKKVIFLDDSETILKVLSYTVSDLVSEGIIELKTYNDSKLFAQMLEEGNIEFDILFSDINMPDYSGYDICGLARSLEKYKKHMIIALTTEVSESSKKMGKEAGFNGWITKISAPEVMHSTISNMIHAIEKRGDLK